LPFYIGCKHQSSKVNSNYNNTHTTHKLKDKNTHSQITPSPPKKIMKQQQQQQQQLQQQHEQQLSNRISTHG